MRLFRPDSGTFQRDIPDGLVHVPQQLAAWRERFGELASADAADVGSVAQRPLAALREIDWDTTLRDTSRDTWAPSMVSGVVLGMVIGVLVALLLTPKAGREMRQLALETVQRVRGRGDDGVAERTLADVGIDAERDLRLRHAADYEPTR